MRQAVIALMMIAAILFAGCSSKVADGTIITVLYSSEARGKLEGCGCKKNGGGITKRSAKIEQARGADDKVIYCDAGNFLTGTPEVDNSDGLISVAAYNHMGATVVNVSERELARGMDAFEAAKKAAQFRFVSANVRSNGRLVADQYIIKTVKNVRIGFVGLCGSEQVMRIDSTKLPSGVTIDDPLTTARKVIPDLMDKVDLLFILSTCGDQADSAIAEEFHSVNAIIGGRSYRANEDSPWLINDTRVVRAQRDGRALGRLDFVFGKEGLVDKVEAKRIDLETTDPTDDEMLSLIREKIPGFVDNPQDGVRIKG
ncbi:MAG: bifunctional metallophosphatase/5'-nucleotidase [Calditrichaeota bacterium]|nr:bifunctional metallophosphatase/5'-nucleotidase [Calditrichota bacterium]MCB9368086.1 bifunctional metallophosphatase/5'-nucleotidase [Calditrichota bacterium]